MYIMKDKTTGDAYRKKTSILLCRRRTGYAIINAADR